MITTVSPAGRTVTARYNPDSLLLSEVSVPGLLPAGYEYDDRGRIKSVTSGTRSVTYEYDTGLMKISHIQVNFHSETDTVFVPFSI